MRIYLLYIIDAQTAEPLGCCPIPACCVDEAWQSVWRNLREAVPDARIGVHRLTWAGGGRIWALVSPRSAVPEPCWN